MSLPITQGIKRKERSPETAFNVGGGESSSTSSVLDSSPEWKYDVFLSFAGKDTRLNFTDHLYEAFTRSGIRCFKDDVDLQKGEDINSLFQAIEGSLCAVLVISQNYAKSTWCLDELQKILESQEKLGQRVFPIFYKVDPADVRHQRGSFGEALAELEDKFKENPTEVQSWRTFFFLVKMQSWRTALSKIGSLSGWPTGDKQEADLVKNIVGDVWRFLSTKLRSFNDNLVGIDSKVADAIPFLEIGSDDKRFVGIWGMGGVGKTTLARVVFQKLSHRFEICCFLEKVKEALSLPEGLVSLQKRLLSGLIVKGLKIHDSYDGMQKIRSRLYEKKVLLVLDDIDDMDQLKDLAESPDWFGEGSRIIITTRDSHSLTSIGVERIYEMKTKDDDESLQIFSKIAFKNNHPSEKYLEYSKSVVKCVGGLPLALRALGAYLCGRKEEAAWRDALDKLKLINPYKNILQVLKLSYDGLDEQEQTIFLDIVCFFKHWKKKEVTKILKGCDLNPILGIKVLIEKTLLVETEFGELHMHDLYEDLGLKIIQQKSTIRRLWKFEEIKEVLKNNKGSGEIEAIVSNNHFRRDGDKIEVIRDKMEVHPEAFSNMSRLKLLFFSSAVKVVPAGLKKLSCALKCVHWPFFPLEALPLPLDELVHIEMPNSNMKQLWNGIKCRGQTKYVISDEEEENMLFPYDEELEDDVLLFELKRVEPEYHPLRNFIAIMPSGGKIPSWFDPNIKYYDEGRYECEIEVEVPPNFRDSKWSGIIIVCLHLNQCGGMLSWGFKAPEDDIYNGWAGAADCLSEFYIGGGLCVMVLEFNEETCWQHLRGGNNSLHIQLSLGDIWGYGWRVICKEDIQNWCHPNHFDHFTQPQHAPTSVVELPFKLIRSVLVDDL